MKPQIRQSGGLYVFDWADSGVTITISRSREERSGAVSGEVHVVKTSTEGKRSHLSQGRLNFLAPRSKAEFANSLKRADDSVLWEQVVEQLAYYFLERFREGEPVLTITTEDEVEPPKYLIGPVLPEDHPTIIFGAPGSGKSLFASVLGVTALLPWTDNPLGFVTNGKVREVLYLDWETDDNELRWRLKCLRDGMDLGMLCLHYRRCALPLVDDLVEIQRQVMERGIGLLIIDSLGPACGGDLTAAEPALRLFAALRQLRVTSLILAHERKNKSEGPTPYGSIFFLALARSVWEARKVQEVNENQFIMGLFHSKVNASKLHPPMGFQMQFKAGALTIRTQKVAEIPELASNLSLPKRILFALTNRVLGVAELVEELDAGSDAISVALNRLQKKGRVIKMQAGWAKCLNPDTE